MALVLCIGLYKPCTIPYLLGSVSHVFLPSGKLQYIPAEIKSPEFLMLMIFIHDFAEGYDSIHISLQNE